MTSPRRLRDSDIGWFLFRLQMLTCQFPLEWVDWFNHRRLLEPNGNIPPAEAEQNYSTAMDNVPMAA